jgi:hypothetical protein
MSRTAQRRSPRPIADHTVIAVAHTDSAGGSLVPLVEDGSGILAMARRGG